MTRVSLADPGLEAAAGSFDLFARSEIVADERLVAMLPLVRERRGIFRRRQLPKGPLGVIVSDRRVLLVSWAMQFERRAGVLGKRRIGAYDLSVFDWFPREMVHAVVSGVYGKAYLDLEVRDTLAVTLIGPERGDFERVVAALETGSTVPSAEMFEVGLRLANALRRYEASAGTLGVETVLEHDEFREYISAEESSMVAPRPQNRWVVVLRRGEAVAHVVGEARVGSWRVEELRVLQAGLDGNGVVTVDTVAPDDLPALGSPPRGRSRGWFDDPAHRYDQRFFDGQAWTRLVVSNPGKESESSSPDWWEEKLKPALVAVPQPLWVVVGVPVTVAGAWLWFRSGPTTLRVLAWFTIVFVAAVFICLVPRSMRALPAIYGVLVISILGLYLPYAVAPGGLGWGWPIDAWRDLFENNTVLIDVLDNKRVEEWESCGQYTGCHTEYRYWITVGGREWVVSAGTYNVLRGGEVVEIGYRPHTKAIDYVAYGPGLSATRGAKQLRVAVSLAPSERKVFEDELLPQFKQRSGLDVTFLQMETDKLMEILDRGGTSPFDVLAIDNDRIGELAAMGAIQDLTEYRDIIPAEVLPSLRSLGEIDGHTMVLPFRPNVMVTYYDQRRLEALGIAPPRTWPELLATASRLEQAGGKGLVLQGASGPPAATELVEFLLQAGADPLALDTPEARQALQFLAELAPHLDRHTNHAKFDTVNQYLTTEKTSLAPNWTFGVSEVIVGQHKNNLAIYPGWAGPAGAAHVLGGDVLAIPKGAHRTRGAHALAKYLMSKPAQATMANRLFWPAVRTDAYDTSDPHLAPYWEAIDEAMNQATPRPTVPCWSEIEQILGQVWQEVVERHGDIDDVVNRRAPAVAQLASARAGSCARTQPTVPSYPTPSQSTGDAFTSSANITRSEYDRLAVGMTYPEVAAIIGGEGQLLLGQAEDPLTVYGWTSDRFGTISASVVFENGKLKTKHWFECPLGTQDLTQC